MEYSNTRQEIIGIVAEELYCSSLFVKDGKNDNINEYADNIGSCIEFGINSI